MDKDSIRRMERDMGREPVRQLSRWQHAYKVKSSTDGCTITVGYRIKFQIGERHNDIFETAWQVCREKYRKYGEIQ